MGDPVDLNELRESFRLVSGVPAAEVLALLDAYRITREALDEIATTGPASTWADLAVRRQSQADAAIAAADALVTKEDTDG